MKSSLAKRTLRLFRCFRASKAVAAPPPGMLAIHESVWGLHVSPGPSQSSGRGGFSLGRAARGSPRRFADVHS